MRPFLCVLSLALLCGCFAHSPVKRTDLPELNLSGSAFDGSQLKSGGMILLSVFKAGPRAESNDQLDQISVMLIKGITETLQTEGSSFTVTDRSPNASYVLDGYVEEFSQPGKFDRLVMRKKRSKFSVSGQIYSKKTGLKVLSFAASQDLNTQKEDIMSVAFAMGKAIGEYVVSQSSKGQP